MVKKTRRLSRAEREKRKEARKQRIMSLVLVFIMLGGLAGFATFNSTGDENGVRTIGPYDVSIEDRADFYRSDRTVQTITLHVGDDSVPFYTYPDQFSQINSSADLKGTLSNKSMVVISGLGDETTENQLLDMLRYDLSNNAPMTVVGAIPENVSDSQLPVIGCGNATASQPVVSIDFGNQTRYMQDDSCIEITMRPEHTHLVRDRLLYNMYGVSA
ncbi:MAG: hypothetical protein ACLFTH_00235 [Candidatus Woesearchaeota archaeon]